MAEWQVSITKSSCWPTPWMWSVFRNSDLAFRCGWSMTKDRARVKAIRAKRSIETDDVRVSYD